ncbi:MAG: hypothetical protein IKD09_08020 [Lentisphaeria bacterium]|nr:hypothetical protein [Lentisphaeria bacterium]
MKKFGIGLITLIFLFAVSGCKSLSEQIRSDAIAQAEPSYEVPTYFNLPPIEIIYDSNPDLSEMLEDYLEENSATLVIAANYDKIKDSRFIKLEILADTVQVLKSDLLEHVLVVAITPSPIQDEAGNIYACSPRYFRISTETTVEYEQDYDNLIKKLLANQDFYNTLQSIVQ